MASNIKIAYCLGLPPATLSNPAWRPNNWLLVYAEYVQSPNDPYICGAQVQIQNKEPENDVDDIRLWKLGEEYWLDTCESVETSDVITAYVGGPGDRSEWRQNIYGNLKITALEWIPGKNNPATTTEATTEAMKTTTTEEYEYSNFQKNTLSFSLTLALMTLFFK